jgi:myo-inositol-1(or 4)-monophosphatase
MSGALRARSALESVSGLVDRLLPEVIARRAPVRLKPDGSPQTDADLFLEAEILGDLERSLPGIAVVSEETLFDAASMMTGVFAVLDPIDGTENFCSGLKEWGVSLSIWIDGVHAGSMLKAPELGIEVSTGSPVEYHTSRISGFSSSYHAGISRGIELATEYRVIGSATCNFINVIRGSFASFTNPKGAYIWDLLPGALLALEHGCEVFINEEPYDGRLLPNDQKYRFEVRHRFDRHPGQGR